MHTNHSLSEHDIRSFMKEPINRSESLGKGLLSIIGLLAVAAVAYLALNMQSLLFLNSNSSLQAIAVEATPTPTPEVAAVATATPEPTPEAPTIPENTLSFAALGISAPIAWDVPLDEKTQEQILPNSTIHIGGTAKPGQTGVTFISGHSSNYPWVKGAYNSIFAPLTKAATGQIIEINYQNKLYRYEVTQIYEVKPSQVEVLESKGQNGLLRLSTCTPIGTDLNRLIVEAKQIYPTVEKNTAFEQANFTGQIPSAR